MKMYILYDGRAIGCGTENASVYCTATSLKEIINDSKNYGDGAIYSYDVHGESLKNETLVQCVS